MLHRERPGDGPAPIMSHNDRFLAFAVVVDHGQLVADEPLHRIVFHTNGLVAEVVAALVVRHDLKVRRQSRHLIAPAVPEVRKAVNHDHQLPRTLRNAMQFATLIVDKRLVSRGVRLSGLGCRCICQQRKRDNVGNTVPFELHGAR